MPMRLRIKVGMTATSLPQPLAMSAHSPTKNALIGSHFLTSSTPAAISKPMPAIKKITRNEEKYPAEKVRGSAKKYSEYE